jgi:hypothetical protein
MVIASRDQLRPPQPLDLDQVLDQLTAAPDQLTAGAGRDAQRPPQALGDVDRDR